MLLDLHLINLYKQMVFRNLKISISNPLVKNWKYNKANWTAIIKYRNAPKTFNPKFLYSGTTASKLPVIPISKLLYIP